MSIGGDGNEGSTFYDQIHAIYEEDTGLFHKIVECSGLSKTLDFKNRDLRGVTFDGADLREFDFSGSDLRGTYLRLANIIDSSTNLSNATLDRDDKNWLDSRMKVEIYGARMRFQKQEEFHLDLEFGTKNQKKRGPSSPFGVLDIGTTKVACLIGRVDANGNLRVLGTGWQKGRGVKAGEIVDIEEAERAIRAAVGQAEDMADTRLRGVTVNLSCGRPESQLFTVQCPVGGRAITNLDIRRVITDGRSHSRIDGREAIHVLPLEFSVDGARSIEDPRGLFGDLLTARVHLIDAAMPALRILGTAVENSGLHIVDLVSAPCAASLVVLGHAERELGAIIIDMGGGTTSIAVFNEGHLLHTAQFPIGGAQVTIDIARSLNTPIAHAERLKTLYGTAQSSAEDEWELLPVPQLGEEEHNLAKVPRSTVVNIIRPRLEEIFELLRGQVKEFGPETLLAGAPVVLTGGASQLAGTRELAMRTLNRNNVRLARPVSLPGLPDSASGPGFTTVVGLLMWAAGQGRTILDIDMLPERPGGLLRRIVNYLKDRA